MAARAEETEAEEDHAKRLARLKAKLNKIMDVEQLKRKAEVEGLVPARIASALSAGNPKLALIALILASEEAKERKRRAERRAEVVAKEAKLKQSNKELKERTRTSIIVKYTEDVSGSEHSEEGKWSLMPSDVWSSRRQVTALAVDEERDREAAVSVL